MKEEMLEKSSVIGRTEEDLKKYGEKGTAYIGKVVLSSGENPVLGRKILMDVAKPHLVLICGKRGGGKCVTGDTLITLEDGSIKPIQELENYFGNVFSLSHDYKITQQQKLDFFKRTVSKILKVKMRSGKEIKLTPEHPLLTVDGWKQVQELKIGSRIATPRIIPVFGNSFLKESEIKILAYMITEGHYKRRATWFSNTDEKIIQDFTSSVNDFDENLQVNLSDENNYRVVSKEQKFKIIQEVRERGKFAKGIQFQSHNTLRKWFIELGIYGQMSHDKIIPKEIFTLPKQKISLFLNRLFSCDGTIYFDKNTQSWRISYASVSEKLIRQVQHLLLRFEIMGTIRQKNHKLNGKQFKSFELVLYAKNVEKYLQEIGFYGIKEERQKQAIEEMKNIKRNENIDTIPKEIWNTYRPKSWADIGRNLGFAYPKSMRESIHYSPTRTKLLQIAQLDGSELMEKFATSDIFWDEIKQIEEINQETEVFDLTVAEEHNFVANDIIIHNSYSMAVVLEELARQPREVRNRISVITIDTVGIFWTLKIPNSEEKAELSNWDLSPDKTDAQVLVPKGKLDFYKEKKLPVDGSFTIKTSELDDVEWLALFELTWKDPEGVALSKAIESLKEKIGTLYDIKDIITTIHKDADIEPRIKDSVINRLKVAMSWGIFEKEGTKIKDIAKPGVLTVIDVSAYRQAIGMQGVRDIIVGLIGKKLFEERMLYRKEEEMKSVQGLKKTSDMPIVWMLIDEAHMFMPSDENSIALNVLLEWIRVGRQPGLSLVLATQRPNKLHADAISQCDLFISHRMTSQPDIAAVSALRPSYLHQDFDKIYQEMPRGKGYAVVLDDNSEKLWLIKVRPRFSWDGGKTATAFIE